MLNLATDWLLEFAKSSDPATESERKQLTDSLASSASAYLRSFDPTPEGESYVGALASGAAGGGLADMPLVPVHGDYWVANIYGTERVEGIIDWEYYRPFGLPLFDTSMLCISSSLAFCRYPGRSVVAAALKACLFEANPVSSACADAMKRYARALKIPWDARQIEDLIAWWLVCLSVREFETYGSHFTMDPRWRDAFLGFLDLREQRFWHSS